MQRTLRPVALCLLLLAPALAQEPADTIYRGGPILTMDDARPRAEALAVRDGLIVGVGSLEELAPLQGESTRIVDLGGHALLPGFVDAHGHVGGVGLQALAANLLAPPDGRVTDIASLQEVLRSYAAEFPERVSKVDVILGFGYDDSQLAEQRHPTREELDAVSTEVPVYIVHQSGHIGVASTKALQVIGYDESSEDPKGGVIRREEGSRRPNGVLEETPHFVGLMGMLQKLDLEGAKAMMRAGVGMLSSYGYTTAQEGRATTSQAQLWAALGASEEGLPIDVVAYPDVLVDRDYITESVSSEYQNRFRVAGAKLTIDGSPQGFTAWRDRPYYDPPENFRSDYVGYPAATADQVFDAIDWAFDHDIQILTHSNGEAATDLLLAAIGQAAEQHGNDDRRPVLIHGQFLREDQVAGLDRLGVFPSLFPMHTFYWGDWHRERTVGPVAAENISPTGWVLARGMRFSSHHDAPVAFPDSMRILDATVTRRSRSGDILGPHHRVDVMTALKAMTIWPAYQHYEEARKGSLEVGKLADLVVLSADPTAVDPETLDTLKVLRTIKEDVVVYEASEDERHGGLEWRATPRGGDAFAAFLRGAAHGTGDGHDHGDGEPACATATLVRNLAPVFDRAMAEQGGR